MPLLDTSCPPVSSVTTAVSYEAVAHAARVHASVGPIVKAAPFSMNMPLHVLQSTRAVKRAPSNVMSYVAPEGAGCTGCAAA